MTSTGTGDAENRRGPTMADVADYLGVSRQLVSLVLRDQPGPSERTRTRVLKAAADLGYEPHLGAQGLRQSRSRHIGVGFVPSNFNEAEIVEELYPLARAAGYGLVLSAQTSRRATPRVLSEFHGYRCAGTVLIGSTIPDEELRALVRRSPVPVTMVSHGEVNPDYDVVHSAGDLGIAQCVHHLYELGHRDIAYINVPSIAPAPLRLAGYISACVALGIEPRVSRSPVGRPEEEGAAAARSLLESPQLPTAVVCANDQSALGAAMVFLESGYRIPLDISITGFDDSRIAAWSFMELTSARQDPAEMGAKAVEAIVRRIDDPTKSPREYVIEPTLVVRESTAPPRA